MFTKLSKCNIPSVLNKLICRSVLQCKSVSHAMSELANSAGDGREWSWELVLSSEEQSELGPYYHVLHHLFKLISSLEICDWMLSGISLLVTL